MEQEVLKVRFKKLVENAVMPTYKTVGAAGMDITTIRTEVIDYGNQLKAYTGIAVEIPKGYVGLLFPRSSISQTGLILANSVGVVDSGYRGEIKLRFKWIKGAKQYNVGDRIGQLVILPYPIIELLEVDELTQTARAAEGFGSSGN